MSFDELYRALPYKPEHIVFVGLGNPHRGDDAAGLYFLRLLRRQPCFEGARFIEAQTNPENHLQEIIDCDPAAVVFIDAAHLGRPAGEISFIEGSLLDSAAISTHAFSIRIIEAYLKAVAAPEVLYIGIQPLQTRPGSPMSTVVRSSIEKLFAEATVP